MTYNFFDVRPVSRLGLPKLKVTTDGFSILFPSALAADLKLAAGQRVNVQLGQNAQRKFSLLRIYPAADGMFTLQANGRHGGVQLALAELRPSRDGLDESAEYVAEGDGSISVELPQPWALRSERALRRSAGEPAAA
jgi:hypothetical protein